MTDDESLQDPVASPTSSRPRGAVTPSPAGADPPEQQVSVLEAAAVLLRQRWSIVMLAIAAAALVGIATFLQERHWTANTSFMPQQPTDLPGAQLTSLAGQFGIDLGSESSGQTPEFYVELIRSREILGRLATDSFEVAVERDAPDRSGGETRRALMDMIDLEEEDPAVRKMMAIERLREEILTVSTSRETEVVKVAVRTDSPNLSRQIASRIVELVNGFNLESRQSQAAAERRFIESRVDATRDELRAAENALQEFLQSNRDFQNAPQLLFEHDRLQRQVDMRQQVYTSLVQSHEQARIGEVRNTPLITVIEHPETPVRPDSRGLVLKVAVALVLGGLAGILVAFMREFLDRQREQGARDYQEVSGLWRETKGDLRRLMRRGPRSEKAASR